MALLNTAKESYMLRVRYGNRMNSFLSFRYNYSCCTLLHDYCGFVAVKYTLRFVTKIVLCQCSLENIEIVVQSVCVRQVNITCIFDFWFPKTQ